MKSRTACLKPVSGLFIFGFGLFLMQVKVMGGRVSRVRIYFVVSCGFFISQVLRNEFWTCCMADYIQEPFRGLFGLVYIGFSFSPSNFREK